MKTICLYFQIHQPLRFKRYRFFDIGRDHYYYDDYANESILRKVAYKCYFPANKILLELIKKYNGKFRLAFSITGIAIEQFELYAPEVIDSFRELAKTGCVEFLSETFSHSLVSVKDKNEFIDQVRLHSEKIESHFGQKPTVFRNTELIYSNEIGATVAEMGYKAMLTEGAKHILGWKSPNFLYYNTINPRLKILLKNHKLSDDIAFRFSNRNWKEWPLTAEKYVGWLENINKKEEIINLFMDYETFGEHQWTETGIFEFLKAFPKTALASHEFKFQTPSEVAETHQPVAAYHVPHPISWADEERDLTAWLGNDLQYEAFNKLYQLSDLMKECKDDYLLKDWEYLQASDHFYYMCTKFFSDGEVHKYFNPYESPYDAFINYMNILSDFTDRLYNATTYNKVDATKLKAIIEDQDKKIKKYEKVLKQVKDTSSLKKKKPSQKRIRRPNVKDEAPEKLVMMK